MHENGYAIAELSPDELNEIKRFEQQLSERSGHTIALIAYDIENTDPD